MVLRNQVRTAVIIIFKGQTIKLRDSQLQTFV